MQDKHAGFITKEKGIEARAFCHIPRKELAQGLTKVKKSWDKSVKKLAPATVAG